MSLTVYVTEYSIVEIPSPTCSIDPSDCQSLLTAFNSGFDAASQSWLKSNVLTLSLASPPTSIVVNDQTTLIPDSPGSPYVLTVHNETYAPIYTTESIYLISDAAVATPYDKMLVPGGQLTVTWNLPIVAYEFPGTDVWAFDLPCQLPGNNTPTPAFTSSQCILMAADIQLRYFAPPPLATRDLCADTSPGYNRCKQSHTAVLQRCNAAELPSLMALF
jgi:hypothetical protein